MRTGFLGKFLGILLLLGLQAGPAVAICRGTSLLETLPEPVLREVRARAAGVPYATGRLWEVRRNGARSVLFGTMHTGVPDIAALPRDVAAEVDAARKVYVELTAGNEAGFVRAMMAEGRSLIQPAGRLRAALSAEEWGVFTEALKPFGMRPGMASRLSPWALTVILSTPPCAGAAKGVVILDRQVEQRAEAAGVPVAGLDTRAGLVRLLRLEDEALALSMFRAALPVLDRARDLTVTAETLYRQGDAWLAWEVSRALMQPTDGADRDAMMAVARRKLLDDRNRDWVRTLLPELRQGGVVVAVGALHLPGEAGLLRLLEKEGFAVRRIRQ